MGHSVVATGHAHATMFRCRVGSVSSHCLVQVCQRSVVIGLHILIFPVVVLFIFLLAFFCFILFRFLIYQMFVYVWKVANWVRMPHVLICLKLLYISCTILY